MSIVLMVVVASLVASTRAAADPSFVMYCNSRETDGDEIVNFMSELANTTRFLRFKNCDMTRLDFGFLARLDLRHLQVEGGKLREFRGMPRLERLSVVEVSAAGFRRWYGPDLTPQLWSVRLEGAVDDESMDDIVDALLPYAATLQHLELRRTSLTRLPDRLALLAGVFVNVEGNTRPLTIPFGSVSGTFPYFSVRDSKIDSIEAGAFQGDFTGSVLDFLGSEMPAPEEKVFGQVLQTMVRGGRGGLFFGDFGVCDCRLSWLFGDDKRSLLFYVQAGRCFKPTQPGYGTTEIKALAGDFFSHCSSDSSGVGSADIDLRIVPSG